MAIHVAITRRVLPGREVEFQQALREFFHKSFTHNSVLGASMLTPGPDSGSREFGILRTFADERERDAFYASEIFKQWEARARTMTEGEPEYRQLHGLEAWFRSPHPPPRWKMALVTLLGVYPASVLLGLMIGPALNGKSIFLSSLIIGALMVAMLTWILMPLLTRLLKPWLHSK